MRRPARRRGVPPAAPAAGGCGGGVGGRRPPRQGERPGWPAGTWSAASPTMSALAPLPYAPPHPCLPHRSEGVVRSAGRAGGRGGWGRGHIRAGKGYPEGRKGCGPLLAIRARKHRTCPHVWIPSFPRLVLTHSADDETEHRCTFRQVLPDRVDRTRRLDLQHSGVCGLADSSCKSKVRRSGQQIAPLARVPRRRRGGPCWHSVCRDAYKAVAVLLALHAAPPSPGIFAPGICLPHEVYTDGRLLLVEIYPFQRSLLLTHASNFWTFYSSTSITHPCRVLCRAVSLVLWRLVACCWRMVS